jgi:hypothetical protein
MPSFESYELLVPELWKKADDWQEALKESEGADRQCVLIQLRAVNLLRTLKTGPATPEHVAWMTLWTRAFVLLDGVRGILTRNAAFTTDVLARVAFETALYTQAILEPAIALHELERHGPGRTLVRDSARDSAWREVVDRMRAYTAWCMWSDLRYCDEVADSRTQDGIWDPEPARGIASDPDALKAFEAYYGPLDLRNEHELERDQQQQLAGLAQKRERIVSWLSDKRLQEWVTKLKSLQAGEPNARSFLSLLFGEQGTIARRLGMMQQRFAYFRYLRGSLLIHGSSVDEMLMLGQRVLAPAIRSDDEEVNRAAYDVASSCNLIVLGLFLTQKHIWPIDP